jgi:hypothetical protein
MFILFSIRVTEVVEVMWKIWDLSREYLYLIRNGEGLMEAIKETARMKPPNGVREDG